MGQRLRLLFMAEGTTLAHLVRLATLANVLDPDKFEITFAHGQMSPLVRPLIARFNCHLMNTAMQPDVFLKSLARGSWPYSLDILRLQVKEDLSIIEACAPDLIFGDVRLSLIASARLARRPYVNLSNLVWSPQAQLRRKAPDVPLSRFFGPRLSDLIFPLISPIILRAVARPYNRLLRENSLPTYSNFLEIFSGGDYTLFADPKGVIPHSPLPAHQREIGMIDFMPTLPLPDWMDKLPHDRPLIYINLGSSGRPECLETLLCGLRPLGVTTVLALAGAKVALPSMENLFVADYLPSDKILDRAKMFIYNGGSLAGYSALLRGVPLLSLPSNPDQVLFTETMENLGVTGVLRVCGLTAAQVQKEVSDVLNSTRIREKVIHTQKVLESTSAPREFLRFLDEFLGSR